MNWYIKVLKQYADFNGRAHRTEFWMFILFSFLVSLALTIIDVVLGLGILAFIYWLAVLVPSIAVTARRLHDTGKSGWWQLVGLVPLVGFIILIVLLVIDSEAGANKFGSNPKGGDAAA